MQTHPDPQKTGARSLLPRRASAVFSSAGVALDADVSWQEQLGHPPSVAPALLMSTAGLFPPELAEALGLEPFSPRAALCSGVPFTLCRETIGETVILRLEPEPVSAEDPSHHSFLRVASHDLRGPLANIRSYASLLMSPRFELGAKALKGIEVIARNADRALELGEQLFNVWKHERGELPLEREWLAPDALLADALAEAQAAREQPPLSPPVLAPGALPELALDPDRIRPALKALLAHALERGAAAEGDPVELHAEAQGDGILIETRDRGPALTPENAAHAFELGYVVPRARKLDTAFGLCVGALFVEMHGGRCEAHTDSSGVTRLSFWLPRGEADEPPAPEGSDPLGGGARH